MANGKKKSHPILSIIMIAIMIPIFGIGLFLYTFDINSYRSSIEEAVREQTGRTIKLDGPITWSLSLSHGFSLALNNVVLSNPSWASRPDMARIGTAKLHLDVTGLPQKKLNIIAFELAKTDVQLETSASGAVNWDFTPPSAAAPKQKEEAPKPEAGKKAGAPVSIQVKEVKITDSRFGMKGKDGSVSVYDVPEFTFSSDRKGVTLHYKGSVAGTPVEVDVSGGKIELITQSNWPFNMRALYDSAKIDAHGTLNDNMKKVVIDTFELTSGKTDLSGAVSAAIGGTRPVITGKVASKHFDPDDLKFGSKEAQGSENAGAGGSASSSADKKGGKIFSTDPIALNGLKAADVHLDISIDEMVAGLTTAQQIIGRLDLEGGRLAVSPFTAQIAGSKTDLTLKVDASSPTAHIAMTLQSPSLDMSQLFKLGGMESAISGKTNVDIALTTNGQSSRDFAGHANGTINLVMDKGVVEQSVLKDIAGMLVGLFAPGASSLSNPGVNCLAARYVITNGLMESKGMLLDTDMTTIAGTGYINLPDEHISMNLFTKPKGLGLGSMIPPTRVVGDLSNPSFTLDAAGTAQKIVGLLTNGSVTDSGVPNLVTVAGKNTCVATLDNPNTAAPTKPLVPGDAQNVQDKVKDVGNKLLQGIGGGLFGK